MNELGTWEVALLCLLLEKPMHPYEMQQLLAQRRKDKVLGLKRGSLYHAIGRLERWGLIQTVGTGRDGQRPERTTYEISEAGRTSLSSRLHSLLADVRWEASSFMASMSFLVYLPVGDALTHLQQRIERLEAAIEAGETEIREAEGRAGRINLLESEYAVTLQRAELDWVSGLVDDLKNGRLTWNLDEILGKVAR